MTVKLYYDDASLFEFSATRVAQNVTDRGVEVCLDRSAFYPTSGGQPHDMGTLNDVSVIDVWEDDQGEIWHLLPHPLETESVIGRIDKIRRFDHMQQHTGQHMLSAGFFNLCQATTIGFHLGTEVSTIDLDIAELSWNTAFQVEMHVNTVVWENRPITISYVNQDNVEQIPLRKPPQVTGTIRVIWVQDFDASACGGTHVNRTGQVGIIKITGLERYKGGVRVTFLCGKRALVDYQQSHRTLQRAGEILSVARNEVAEAILRLQDELSTHRKAYTKAQSTLLEMEADRLWQKTPEVEGMRCLVEYSTDRTFADIRRIANQLRDRPRTFILLAVTEEKGVRLVCARSDDLPALDARHILNALLNKLNGRGGGSPSMAQGGCQVCTLEEIQTVFSGIVPSVVHHRGG